MQKRYALDASVLASIVNSDDAEHFSCYSFFRDLNDDDKALWVVPGLIFFEFQATQSRRPKPIPKEERKAYAPRERMGMRMWVHPNALQIKLMHYQILSSTNGGPHG
jgi:hypothetical protein